jgi:hypothetical protein
MMTNFQAFALGMMAVWTPSLVVIAYVLWPAPLVEKEDERVPATEVSVHPKQNARPTLSCEQEVEVPNLNVEDATVQPRLGGQDNCRPVSELGGPAGQKRDFGGTA